MHLLHIGDHVITHSTDSIVVEYHHRTYLNYTEHLCECGYGLIIVILLRAVHIYAS